MIEFILVFLVERAGSNNYQVRAAARQTLSQVSYYSGQYGPIEKGVVSKDPDVRKTCKRIISTRESRRKWVEVPEGLNLHYFDMQHYPAVWSEANRYRSGEDSKVYVYMLIYDRLVDPDKVREMVAQATAKKRERETDWNPTFLQKWKKHLLRGLNGPDSKQPEAPTSPQPYG